MSKLRQLADKPIIGGVVRKAMASLASNDAKAISDHFSQYLRSQVASTDTLRHEVFKLRHDVYCEELNFFDVNESTEEQDQFDELSIHAFVRHIGTGKMAGTVRLIISNDNTQLLPLEKFCSHGLTMAEFSPSAFDRHTILEISRLAVPESFRKRAIDKFKGAAVGAINEDAYSQLELRCFPYIAICLYLSIIAIGFNIGRTNAFVMMEPRLARSLSFIGIPFQQIGPVIEYHGQRAPYYLDGKNVRDSLSAGYKKLLLTVEKEILKDPNTYLHPFLKR